jgi:hypothetical protein
MYRRGDSFLSAASFWSCFRAFFWSLASVLGVVVLVSGFALAKNKKELPDYILHAKTVAVIISPQAGTSVEDTQANLAARRDVEAALQSWGRFEPVMNGHVPDLVIVVRKGNGQALDSTTNGLSDPRQDDRTHVVNPMNPGAGIGAQNGRQPDGWGAGTHDAGTQTLGHPDTAAGTNDVFLVYKGDPERPHDATGEVGWSYVERDGLRPPSVTAVKEFRRALAAAEKKP